MARTRENMRGRTSKTAGFSMLIHAYFQSSEYAELSPRAVKLLIDLYCQYRGKNNGDLCATYSMMKKVGWSSNDQLQKALAELLATGWIIVARRGGRRIPHLYALTFIGIDNTGKLDSHVRASPAQLSLWRHANRNNIVLEEATERVWSQVRQKKISSCRSTAHHVPQLGSEVEKVTVH